MWLLEQSVSESFGREGSEKNSDRFHPNQIVFMGDSAGGGLALSLSLLLRDHGSLPQPLSIVAWSPWLDLTQSLPSFLENASTDCIPYEGFTHRHSEAVDNMFETQGQEGRGTYETEPGVRQRAQVYCPDSCLRMKYVSPLFETDFQGIPSVFIVSADTH
jgi:acetyl esterase/lipase